MKLQILMYQLYVFIPLLSKLSIPDENVNILCWYPETLANDTNIGIKTLVGITTRVVFYISLSPLSFLFRVWPQWTVLKSYHSASVSQSLFFQVDMMDTFVSVHISETAHTFDYSKLACQHRQLSLLLKKVNRMQVR